MPPHGIPITNIIDWCLRGAIALIVSFGGILFKRTIDQLDEINKTLEVRGIRLTVVEVNQQEAIKRLDRFENKLDRILEILRRDNGK